MLTSSEIINSLINHVQLTPSSRCFLRYDAFLLLNDRLGGRLLIAWLICLSGSRRSGIRFRQLRCPGFRRLLLLNWCGFLTARSACARNFIISGLFLKRLISSLSFSRSGRLCTAFLSRRGRLRGFLTSGCLWSGCWCSSWFTSRDSCLTWCRLSCRFTSCSHICFGSLRISRCDSLTTGCLTFGDIKRLIASALLSIINFAINSVPTCIRLPNG